MARNEKRWLFYVICTVIAYRYMITTTYRTVAYSGRTKEELAHDGGRRRQRRGDSHLDSDRAYRPLTQHSNYYYDDEGIINAMVSITNQ
eukprot:scaffold67260_cov53-Attheya_sp.AAC.3